MTVSELEIIRHLMGERCGAVLGPDKEDLVRSRLASLGTLSEVCAGLRRDSDGRFAETVVERLLNHESWFFRDRYPFDALTDHLRRAACVRADRLHVWSAGCAGGQEPYSVAMTLADRFPEVAERTAILATDYSTAILRRAVAGEFTQLEVNRGLPARLLVRHLVRGEQVWRVNPALRERVNFLRLDLSRPWSALPAMDVVLLRNVLVYFDPALRRDVLERVAVALRPGGILMLGKTETTYPMPSGLESLSGLPGGFVRPNLVDPCVSA